MKKNYHTHTARCHHAIGTDEEYVLAAIEGGFDELGFSDHMPWPFNGFISTTRMLPEDIPAYRQSILDLKEKYADRMTIRIGWESEYYPCYLDHLRRIHDMGDYLILGQHFNESEQFNPYVPEECLTDDGIRRYADNAAEAIRTGLFRYIAHPDLYMGRRTPDTYNAAAEEACRVICQACSETHIPLEFNLLGFYTHRGYPCTPFWEQASQYGIPAILGVDAHDPVRLADRETWNTAKEKLQQWGFTILDHLTF